ncbi:MAG: hypothetical protein ABII18_12460 [bacterium]|nr:hypothetical protein [bacterium]MBU1918024.1 hypothetical protein [bacterium]
MSKKSFFVTVIIIFCFLVVGNLMANPLQQNKNVKTALVGSQSISATSSKEKITKKIREFIKQQQSGTGSISAPPSEEYSEIDLDKLRASEPDNTIETDETSLVIDGYTVELVTSLTPTNTGDGPEVNENIDIIAIDLYHGRVNSGLSMNDQLSNNKFVFYVEEIAPGKIAKLELWLRSDWSGTAYYLIEVVVDQLTTTQNTEGLILDSNGTTLGELYGPSIISEQALVSDVFEISRTLDSTDPVFYFFDLNLNSNGYGILKEINIYHVLY